MQLFNLHYCRFLPFVFLLIRSITPNLSGNDHDNHDNDAKVAVSPLLDGSNSPIAMSQNAPEAGQGWPADALFKTDAPFPVVIATDQADDVCSIPPIKEYSQRRRFKRGNACTAPPEPKPRPGNNDGAPKTPENRINPHSGPSFESVPSWKEPNKLPFGSEKCPDPLLNNPVCAFHAPDMTNWVERQYPGITVDLPECYMLPCFSNLETWCCAIVTLNVIKSDDGTTVLSGTLYGSTCMRMNSSPPNRLKLPSPGPGI